MKFKFKSKRESKRDHSKSYLAKKKKKKESEKKIRTAESVVIAEFESRREEGEILLKFEVQVSHVRMRSWKIE